MPRYFKYAWAVLTIILGLATFFNGISGSSTMSVLGGIVTATGVVLLQRTYSEK